MEIKVTGTIKTITFHNEDNGYSVIRLSLDDKQPSPSLWLTKQTQLTAVGTLLNPQKGERLSFYGALIEHPKFGTQLAFTRYEKETIYSKEGLVEYLSSDLFKGVGKVSATKIVNTFKEDTIQVLLEAPEKLSSIKGLKLKDPDQFIEALKSHNDDEAQRIAFYDVGLSPKLINAILKTYEHEAFDKVKRNPYQLIEDVPGIGFERADVIGKRFNIAPQDSRRIQAFIMHRLKQRANSEGHTHYALDDMLDDLLERFSEEGTDATREVLWEQLKALEKARRLIFDEATLTLPLYDRQETIVAKAVQTWLDRPIELDEKAFNQALKELRTDVVYTASQIEALKELLSHRFIILNGGPGTGKTTLVQGLVQLYQRLYNVSEKTVEDTIKLMAPTGKAAKRLSEATQQPATTIHRFLGFKHELDYAYDEHHKAPGALFIVDEASMIDLQLAAALMRALPEEAQLILVGDDGQLPSVGPGQVLRDLLEAKVPTVTLSTIHRQALNSPIIPLARGLREGHIPPLKTVQPSLFFIPLTAEEVHERVIKIIQYWLDQGYDLDQDIQVLVPMYKGTVGIDAFNATIQHFRQPHPSKRLTTPEGHFFLGDKVLQLQNRPEEGIMNGDQGVIVALNEEKSTLTVSFQGIFVEYEKDDLDQLRLAYAISVHKAQGSGFKVVILPLFRPYWVMLKRKLIYTAITRATDHLIVLGELNLLGQSITYDEPPRQTKLQDKLGRPTQTLWSLPTPDEGVMRIDDPSIPFDTLGEPQTSLSPYDFMKEE